MKQRVLFFDLEYAMSECGYTHNPYASYASSEDERTECCVAYQALKDKRGNPFELACSPKCGLCQYVGHMTDYIRGFHQEGGSRTVAKPHYPVPALFVDCLSDLGERWAGWVDTDALHGIRW